MKKGGVYIPSISLAMFFSTILEWERVCPRMSDRSWGVRFHADG